jgi:hypothetical protein
MDKEMKTFRQYVLEQAEPCCEDCADDDVIEEAEYQGRKVNLNNPTRSDNPKSKRMVYVRNDKGNVVKVYFGDPNLEIKRDDPARRKNFRARHNWVAFLHGGLIKSQRLLLASTICQIT